MNRNFGWTTSLLSVAFVAAFAANPVFADKPEGKGKGKGHDKERVEHRRDNDRDSDRGDRDRGRAGPGGNVRFVDQHRVYIRNYYGEQYRKGFCPPGLAKKHNGCMPPGQAKKWQVGRPLPRDVIYYDLPPTLSVEIGVPPAGYRYVRVAADILMIAVGTGLVVDAIQDLGR